MSYVAPSPRHLPIHDLQSFINVDFDFFGPNPAVDFLALRRLLHQLFQLDAELFATNQLTDLILAQPGIGSTVKTDGEDSDPYALLTALNMHVHHEHPSIKSLANYCLDKVSSAPDQRFRDTLHALFSQSQQHVGLVICERLVNMPVQVIPPMYRMLADELRRAISNVRKMYSIRYGFSSDSICFRMNLISFRISCLSPDTTTSLPRKSLPWPTLPRNTALNQKQAYRKSRDRPHLDPNRSHPPTACTPSIQKTLQFVNLPFTPSIFNTPVLQKSPGERMLSG
jgi:hypothetical protein